MDDPRAGQAVPLQTAVPKWRDGWHPVVVGEPIIDFEPRPASALPYRPDYIADGWSTAELAVRAASIRGYAHRYSSQPRQDDVATVVHGPSGTVVFAVADGVSEARQSHVGAALACRTAIDTILHHLEQNGAVDWKNVLHTAAWQLVEHARHALGLEGPDSAQAERLLATTIVAGTATPSRTGCVASMVQVGDSGAWLLRDGAYECLLETKTPSGSLLSASTVSGLPRVPEQVVPRTVSLPADGVLLVGTDGFGDPLGDGTGPVGALFAHTLIRPPPPLTLAHCLDFSRETFDDDRTLLALWPRNSNRLVGDR